MPVLRPIRLSSSPITLVSRSRYVHRPPMGTGTRWVVVWTRPMVQTGRLTAVPCSRRLSACPPETGRATHDHSSPSTSSFTGRNGPFIEFRSPPTETAGTVLSHLDHQRRPAARGAFMRVKSSMLVFLLIAFIGLADAATAQQTGAVSGTLTNSLSGDAVANAIVVLESPSFTKQVRS